MTEPVLISPAIRARLKPLLLMLTAPTQGERDNAVSAITRILKQAGLDWHDLTNVLAAEEPTVSMTGILREQEDGRFEIKSDDLLKVVAIIERSGDVNDYVTAFLNQLRDRADRYPTVLLSVKQTRWLSNLHWNARPNAKERSHD